MHHAKRKGTQSNMSLRISKVLIIRIYHRVVLTSMLLLGTAHGFAARPNLALPEIEEAFEQAFNQTVHWFDKTLVVN